jgi:glycolate oxidase
MVGQDALRKLIQALGVENVLIKREDLLCYAYDATPLIKKSVPDVILTPCGRDDVVSIVKIANEHMVPIYPRGAGTNLSGGAVPLQGGIVLSLLKMNNILDVDTENLTATVEPGVIVQDLNDEIGKYGLIYPPDPGTVATATMGGTVAECAGGLRGLKYGVTKHYIIGLEVVLTNGDVIKCGGKTVKNVSGYDMTSLFVGSEGTLGIITEITVKLMPAPDFSRSMIAVFDDLGKAGKAIADVIANKVIPATMEIMDNLTIRTVENYAKVGLPTEAEAVLLIELDGMKEIVEKEVDVVIGICKTNCAVDIQIAEDEAERDRIWTARRVALPALAQIKPTVVLEDATVPRSKIPDMIKACLSIGEKNNIMIAVMGHAGDGNLHPILLADTGDKEEITRLEKAVEEIFAAAIKFGGTLSGEHGIGIAKAKFMEWEFGETGLVAMKKIKRAFDPNGMLNPGKIFI